MSEQMKISAVIVPMRMFRKYSELFISEQFYFLFEHIIFLTFLLLEICKENFSEKRSLDKYQMI